MPALLKGIALNDSESLLLSFDLSYEPRSQRLRNLFLQYCY